MESKILFDNISLNDWERWPISNLRMTFISITDVAHNCFIYNYSWKGICDDLKLLLDEDMNSVNLCALHCKMRNTEQILESLGLYAYKIGALESLNEKLAELGPKSMKKNFIRIKDNRNKNLEVTKNHIKIVSISGR